MATRWFIYIFAFSFSISLYILYTQYEAFLLFALLAAVPAISSLLLFISQWILKMQLPYGQFTVLHGDEAAIPVILKNRFHLPLADFTVSVKMKDANGRLLSERELSIESFIFANARRKFTYKGTRCGKIELQFAKSTFYDLLGLFAYSKKMKVTATVFVMPRLYESFADIKTQALQTAQAAGELMGIRPYQYGDSSRNIHWKASIAHDDIYVKEFYAPSEITAVLLMDIIPDAEEKICNGIYETFYAVGAYLIGRYGSFEFLYLMKNGAAAKIRVANMDDFERQLIVYMSVDHVEEHFANLQWLADNMKENSHNAFYISASDEQEITENTGLQSSSMLTVFVVGRVSAACGMNEIFIDENDVAGNLAAGVWRK